MRVRHLQSHVQSQRLLESENVSALANMTVGIETTAWLRSSVDLKDALMDIMGGLPLGVDAVMDQQIDDFAKLKIFPVFCFQGLAPYGHSLFNKMDPNILAEGWRLFQSSSPEAAGYKFSRTMSRISEELLFFVTRHLRAREYAASTLAQTPTQTPAPTPAPTLAQTSGSDGTSCKAGERRLAVIGCPYLCLSQMKHLHRAGRIDAILGLPSHCAMGFKRVYTTLDVTNKKAERLDRDRLLAAWNVTESQLADACILAGSEYCYTLPHFNIMAPLFNFELALSLARSGPLASYLEYFPDHRIQTEFRHLYALSRLLMITHLAWDPTTHLVVNSQPTPAELATHTHTLTQSLTLTQSHTPTQSHTLTHPQLMSAPFMPQHASQTQGPQPYGVGFGYGVDPSQNLGGQVVGSQLPTDAHKVYGWRLPDTVFALMALGLLSPTLPRILSYGEWRDIESPVILSKQYDNLLVQTFSYLSRHCQDPLILLTNVTNSHTNKEYQVDLEPRLKFDYPLALLVQNLVKNGLQYPNLAWCLSLHMRSLPPSFTAPEASLLAASRTPAPALPKTAAAAGTATSGNAPGPSSGLTSGSAPRSMPFVFATGTRTPTDADRRAQDRESLKVTSEISEAIFESYKQKQCSPGGNHAAGSRSLERKSPHPLQQMTVARVMFSLLDCLEYFDYAEPYVGGATAMGWILEGKGKKEFVMENLLGLELLKLGLLSGKELDIEPKPVAIPTAVPCVSRELKERPRPLIPEVIPKAGEDGTQGEPGNDKGMNTSGTPSTSVGVKAQVPGPKEEEIQRIDRVLRLLQVAMEKDGKRRISSALLTPASLREGLHLIGRACSLIKIPFKPTVKHCPANLVDFHFGAYASLLRTLRKDLNTLVEACVANLVLEDPQLIHVLTPDLFDPSHSVIPYFAPVPAFGGVLITAVLTAVDSTAKDLPGEQYEALAAKYSDVADFWPTILRLCEFWAQFSKVIYCLTKMRPFVPSFERNIPNYAETYPRFVELQRRVLE